MQPAFDKDDILSWISLIKTRDNLIERKKRERSKQAPRKSHCLAHTVSRPVADRDMIIEEFANPTHRKSVESLFNSLHPRVSTAKYKKYDPISIFPLKAVTTKCSASSNYITHILDQIPSKETLDPLEIPCEVKETPIKHLHRPPTSKVAIKPIPILEPTSRIAQKLKPMPKPLIFHYTSPVEPFHPTYPITKHIDIDDQRTQRLAKLIRLRESKRLKNDPKVMVEFGYGCNLQEHIQYGQCLDGKCGKRSTWESAAIDTDDRRRLVGCDASVYGQMLGDEVRFVESREKMREQRRLDSIDFFTFSKIQRAAAGSTDDDDFIHGDDDDDDCGRNFPLHLACQQCDIAATDYLCKCGWDVNARDLVGQVPLIGAISSDCKEDDVCAIIHRLMRNQTIIDFNLLLDRPKPMMADVNACDVNKTSALSIAAKRGLFHVCLVLLSYGADATAPDPTGRAGYVWHGSSLADKRKQSDVNDLCFAHNVATTHEIYQIIYEKYKEQCLEKEIKELERKVTDLA